MNFIDPILHIAALVFMLGYVLKSWRKNPPGNNEGGDGGPGRTPSPENPSPSGGGLTIEDFTVTPARIQAGMVTGTKLRELERV